MHVVRDLTEIVLHSGIGAVKGIGMGKIVPLRHLAHLGRVRVTHHHKGIPPSGGFPMEMSELFRRPFLRSLDLVRRTLGLHDPVAKNDSVSQHEGRQQFLVSMCHGYSSPANMFSQSVSYHTAVSVASLLYAHHIMRRSASCLSSSRKSGCAMEMSASRRSRTEWLRSLAMPYSVTT